MKRYLMFPVVFSLLLCFFVFSGKQINLKTETVFAESETDENTIFPSPTNIAVDGKGNIYISDFKDNVIKKFSPEGKYLMTIGGKGEGPGEFSGLSYIHIMDDRIITVEFIRRQFFDLNGKFIKSERIETLNGPAQLLYFNHGKSFVIYTADVVSSKYNLVTGEFNQKNPIMLASLDAGRNVRLEKNAAYIAITVLYNFDILHNNEIVYARNKENRDVLIYRDGKTQTLYKISGSPVEASDKEKEDNRIRREKLKDNFDIPELKYHSIIKDLKCYKDRVYIWIETQERYGWLCLDGKGNELAFYAISDKSLMNTTKTCIINDYIYYLVRDPETGAMVKRTKLPA